MRNVNVRGVVVVFGPHRMRTFKIPIKRIVVVVVAVIVSERERVRGRLSKRTKKPVAPGVYRLYRKANLSRDRAR